MPASEYISLDGQRFSTKPDERHLHRAPDGVWRLQNPSLPIKEIIQAFDKLDLKCIQLIFPSPDYFWDALEASDFNFIHAGLDPEALCGKDDFHEILKNSQNLSEKMLIYYYNIRHYSHVSQNILSHIEICLGDAYELLSKSNLLENIPLEQQPI